MHKASDTRFWNRIARKYAKGRIADQGGYERTLDFTRAFLRPEDQVLELGCGTGSTALRLAGRVKRYLATDLSAAMIQIAREKQALEPLPGLSFQIATAESPTLALGGYDAVLGFNYLHMVRDVPVTLWRIHNLLVGGGLFVSKTPCLGDMTPLLSRVLLPGMRAIGKAPYVSVFKEADLCALVAAAGFEILAVEDHSTKGKGNRPWIVARKPATSQASPSPGIDLDA